MLPMSVLNIKNQYWKKTIPFTWLKIAMCYSKSAPGYTCINLTVLQSSIF